MGYGPLGDHIYHTLGLNRKTREEYFKNKYGRNFPFERFQELYRSVFQEYVKANGLPTKKGLHELLDFLRKEQIPMAVATSSSQEHAVGNLEKEGIREYFQTVITGNMVSRAKPDPEIYLKACQGLRLPPSKVLALEDSYNGLRSAHQAGMITVMVPDLLRDSACVDDILDEKWNLCWKFGTGLRQCVKKLIKNCRNDLKIKGYFRIMNSGFYQAEKPLLRYRLNRKRRTNMEKKPFVTKEQLDEIVKEFPTPFHLYDEKGIRENARAMKEAFSWNKGFKEYFAVKATPNPFLIQILREYGFGCDCSSYTELMLSKAIGCTGEDIMFSSNDTPAEEFRYAYEMEQRSIWMILPTFLSWKKPSELFQRESAAVLIQVESLRLAMASWTIREMPSTE